MLKPLIGKTDEAEEDEFAAAILAEITKVDRFFQLKETELYAEFRLVRTSCCRRSFAPRDHAITQIVFCTMICGDMDSLQH